ncbi:hypothetical protein F4813DRAFT_396430 [Daldinia decipiens]|uniref:uncharacterized protein n=1 Tax=Daldinia decipiens TaxID=326647 RepID=UPI0020C49860|nr:uncharacterized protein F4813DRAFT_396430 [Daldinia decipiens]KAI1657176.1 hypothetical protein F4813DRAFT_396430 [Daldinia decipiens]
MASSTQYQSGAIVHITQTEKGYKVEQVKLFEPPPFKQPRDGRIDINFNIGPISAHGWIDTNSLAVHLELSVLGISIGAADFDLEKGFEIGVDLSVISGKIRFYGKNGSELWMRYELKALFQTWEDDVKIIGW